MKDQASAKRKPYDSDLADAQWSVIEPLLPPPSRRGRPRKTDLREVVNALVCALRSGCPRRMLPRDLPPWQTVYACFRTWKRDGTLKRVHDALRAEVRRTKSRARRGGHRQPERENHRIGGDRGYDEGKKVNGRKRRVIVDTQGLRLEAAVHPANIQDRDGEKLAMEKLAGRFPELRLI